MVDDQHEAFMRGIKATGESPMWLLFNLVLGIVLVLQGLLRRRREAIWCGSGLLAFAGIEFALIYTALHNRMPIPDVGVHAVVLLPLAVILVVKGARSLR